MVAKKKAAKKAPAKKAPAKKAPAKKAAAKKAPAKKAVAKKAPAKKAPAKKAPAKKAPAKKAPAKKAPAKKAPAKKAPAAKKKPKVKRKPSAAFMKPQQPDEALAAIVGNKPVPRTEIVKKVWAYIKKNSLQDEKNKRMINSDDKLKGIFGAKKQVSMFELTTLVNKHLVGA